MSDLLLNHPEGREPLQASFSDAANPLGLDGIEFIEYATSQPQALGQMLEMMGFRPVARHRSREVLLYRQGELNIVVNAHPIDAKGAGHGSSVPTLSAMALRVRDARAAYHCVLERGAWSVSTHAEVMELNIPAIHGAGSSRIYFVDRYKEFSIYDVDFVPIPSVDQHPPATAGIHFFGIVQYIGPERSNDWIAFYNELFGAELIPDEQRFGIMPKGTLLRVPALDSANRFMLQLIEPEINVVDSDERLQRIGLGVPDVLAAVKALRALGVEFVETQAAHTEQRGAISKTYLGSVVFELVHSPLATAQA
ncbi:4-hydroxyphenylpyruvate dioxygenase [Hydrogenophaga palleronii]|uniref:4-hydroxyphenylpyruvate dioxygenase n=1 Tax=Hydrogenophaga palleronii TaxID=65655 RepID=A0ABU1WGK5_9BURK|nr:4-hydroxyphenylpyruvate dioxygenase [Hydrogenophaga palleronii]MDR7148405.1 4-hydroxyphenylpyruvate dioxygenase [Hydrogenophaga palleronii]